MLLILFNNQQQVKIIYTTICTGMNYEAFLDVIF